VTDIDDGSAKPDIALPAPSKAGAIEAPKEGEAANGDAKDEGAQFGNMTGWAPRFGWPVESTHEGESLLDRTTWLESQVPDTYFGGEVPPPVRK
jgi:hypothetical protein